jgi:hypothetical protein
VVVFSPYNRAADGGLGKDTWILIPVVFAVSIAGALFVAGPIWLVRKRIMGGERP